LSETAGHNPEIPFLQMLTLTTVVCQSKCCEKSKPS
jgi:hypothetical protein